MSLDISENISLASLCTMRLGGPARYLTTVSNRRELAEAIGWAASKNVKVIVIGSASNTIFTDAGFSGLVCLNRIHGIEKIGENSESVTLKVGSGEIWDDFVEYTVKLGLSGVEALSLIPGTVGAAPVQNIGAYGQEVSKTIVEVEAYDTHTNEFITIQNKDLVFRYRTSKLKVPIEKRHLYICCVTFKLSKKLSLSRPLYDSLEKFYADNNISELDPKNIRESVIAIRSAKLPDPKYVANSGSFFTNPVISSSEMLELESKYPGIRSWPADRNMYKISAAWLIDSSGLESLSIGGISFYKYQHLVVVNNSATSIGSLLLFRDKVVKAVYDKFGVTLQQEPELL